MHTELNALTETIIGCAIDVHRALGPGMLESSYRACLAFEMIQRGLSFEQEKPMPLIYRGQQLGVGYRLDFLINNSVVVEAKAIERLEAVHSAQLLSYLRFSGCTVGLLINFNVRWLIPHGVKRIVNGFPD